MFTLPADRSSDLIAHARTFVNADMPYSFTNNEQRALSSFFTNLNRRVFFMHTMPANVGATIGAMYSRMKNPRGVRGTFVDSFLPELLAGMLTEVQEQFAGDGGKFLIARGIKTLDAFITQNSDTGNLFWNFLKHIHVDPDYLAQFTNSQKTRKFLNRWLDAYGHKSIARVASIWLCTENISILAAKSLEWSRPGTGYIELSTRYVNMDGKETYPIADEVAILGDDASIATKSIATCFHAYGSLLGNTNLNGPFPEFLRELYTNRYAHDQKGLTAGIAGETYDVLGNFLPAATLTSVFTAASGEALPSILKHLTLDGTPENFALRDAIVREAEKIGANQFCKHFDPTPAEQMSWSYLSTNKFSGDENQIRLIGCDAVNDVMKIGFLFGYKDGFTDCINMNQIAQRLFGEKRENYDKLPNEFEDARVTFFGNMSFRGWRDLHRQSIASHRRTLLTPYLGFYEYDKPYCIEWKEVRDSIVHDFRAIYEQLSHVPLFMRQYVVPLGFKVGFRFGCNLREFEFCVWQRSKWSVNHEVRRVFLAMENEVRKAYHPWWSFFSRADMTPTYVFARGENPVPFPTVTS